MALSLAMAALLWVPADASAQISRYKNGGLFGNYQQVEKNKQYGLMGGGFRTTDPSYIFNNQAFGSSDGNLTNETFGEETPLGGGIAILLLAGAGYVALKKKED